jgi:hypothetical protein
LRVVINYYVPFNTTSGMWLLVGPTNNHISQHNAPLGPMNISNAPTSLKWSYIRILCVH